MQIDISKTARQRIAVGVAVVALIIGWAWWDGGEEPVRPVAQTIDLAEVDA